MSKQAQKIEGSENFRIICYEYYSKKKYSKGSDMTGL